MSPRASRGEGRSSSMHGEKKKKKSRKHHSTHSHHSHSLHHERSHRDDASTASESGENDTAKGGVQFNVNKEESRSQSYKQVSRRATTFPKKDNMFKHRHTTGSLGKLGTISSNNSKIPAYHTLSDSFNRAKSESAARFGKIDSDERAMLEEEEFGTYGKEKANLKIGFAPIESVQEEDEEEDATPPQRFSENTAKAVVSFNDPKGKVADHDEVRESKVSSRRATSFIRLKKGADDLLGNSKNYESDDFIPSDEDDSPSGYIEGGRETDSDSNADPGELTFSDGDCHSEELPPVEQSREPSHEQVLEADDDKMITRGTIHPEGSYPSQLADTFGRDNARDITWAHAVNSRLQLSNALKLDSDVNMIEVDVMLGAYDPTGNNHMCTGVRDKKNIVILCHPPYSSSNVSLKFFLQQVCKHNDDIRKGILPTSQVTCATFMQADEDLQADFTLTNSIVPGSGGDEFLIDARNCDLRSQGSVPADPTKQRTSGIDNRMHRMKGIKLDFKDEAAVKPTIDLLKEYDICERCPAVFLNADVLVGPGVVENAVTCIDGIKFMQQCSRVPKGIISLGWKCTEISMNDGLTKEMCVDMKNVIASTLPSDEQLPGRRDSIGGLDESNFQSGQHATRGHITFAVGAVYTIGSLPFLKQLCVATNKMGYSCSLTIWTGFGSFGISHEYKDDIVRAVRKLKLGLFVDVHLKDKTARQCGEICSIM